MQLFYDRNFTGSGTAELTAAQSHHCVNVMRMGVGDELWVSDGAGTIYECRLVEAHAKHCTVEVVGIAKKEDAKCKYRIELAVAPTKNIERTEWLVEKAVEVGVASFTPIVCRRSERKTVKLERLERIVESASAQSQKAWLAELGDVTPFEEFVAAHPSGLIAHCNDDGGGVPKIEIPYGQEHYTILIGPEGDFAPEEVAFAIAHGYRSITLGEERLRTETAALYAAIEAAVKSR